MKTQIKKNKGFSLVELLIAITILAIVMVMISSFVTTTLQSQSRTKKDIQVQDEAQRIYYQLSDILMQATYIRVQSYDDKGYSYDADERVVDTSSSTALEATNFVVDNYSNYQKNNGLNSKKVIVDFSTYQLYDESDKVYPKAGSDLDKDADSTVLKSFRALNNSGGQFYIVPKYIYIEYSMDDTEVTTETVGSEMVVKSTAVKKNYVILKYDKDGHTLYMYRLENDGTKLVPSDDNRFAKAVAEVTEVVDETSPEGVTTSKEITKAGAGVISANVKEFYFSANPDGNAVDVAMRIASERFEGHRYDLRETINFRNSNVLTVKPQLLLRWKGTPSGGGGTPSPPPEEGTPSPEPTTP